MIDKKSIGKKVWVLDGSIEMGLNLTNKEVYTIKNVDDRNYPADVIVEKDGKSYLTEEWYIIVIPTDGDILKYLNDNGVEDAVNAEETKSGFVVSIFWGDWKHSHLWCDELMGFLGYSLIREIVTEQDGGDAYSADRYYKKQ